MFAFIANTALAAVIISLSTWLAGRRPELAGFIIALTTSSMIAIALTQANYANAETSAAFAQNILLALPLTCLFFLPILFVGRIGLWPACGIGVLLLAAGYFGHRALAGWTP